MLKAQPMRQITASKPRRTGQPPNSPKDAETGTSRPSTAVKIDRIKNLGKYAHKAKS